MRSTRRRPLLAVLLGMALMAPVLALAYDQYSENGDSTNCAACHGDYRATPYDEQAPGGGTWPDGLHNTHRNTMLDGDCDVCHSSGPRFPVLIDSSAGGDGLPPISCVGCHGRLEDASSGTLGSGAGLRQHHWNAGETDCVDCHADSDPANFTPVGEDVLPPYYANPGNNHPAMPDDSCSPAPGSTEDFAGAFRGLDNDGDGLYDESDPDCSTSVCGNNMVEAGEDCDDGNTSDGDCCSSTCSFEANGSPCDDGVVCTDADTCDGAGSCVTGPPNNALCNDALFCNGVETCDVALDCQPGTPVNCNDAVGCTTDSCDEVNDTCSNTPDDAACDDGLFCNGSESCDPAQDCQAGTAVDCDDGVGCTVDSCDEGGDSCINAPDDGACDDGLFCNGAESCDPAQDCRAGTVVNCDDAEICTDDSCDEVNDECDNVFDPTNDPVCQVVECGNGFVEQGEECDDGNTLDGDCCSSACAFENVGSVCSDGVGCTIGDVCDGAGACNGTPSNAACDDGLFCNGSESCDALLDCQPGTPVDCGDGVGCTTDVCNEASDTCSNNADDAACDDGLFCNGSESCDPVQDCQAGAAVDCDDGVGCTIDSCDEQGDACVNAADDDSCDDGAFCNGTEACDPLLDCQVGTPPDCDDGDICTDDMCNEKPDACGHLFDLTNDPQCLAFCPDDDGDGYSAAGGMCGQVDCDDGDAAVNPGAEEICDDDKDNDCDDKVDAGDDECEFTGTWTVRTGPLQDPLYAGSEACADCHEGHADAWQDSLHARMQIRPGDAQAAGFPLPGADPGRGFEIGSWSDILFVVGQKWRTQYVDRDGFVQGVQWNYQQGQWAQINNGQLTNYDCGACHTTGYDASETFLSDQGQPVAGIVGSWVEYSIGCEACHGPAAAHVANPTRKNVNQISFDWYDPDNDGNPNPVDVRSSIVCANCHYRNDREMFQAGDENHQQFNDWLGSPHSSSLELTGINTYCAKCHSPGNADFFAAEHNFTYFDPSNATHVTCISCHDPHRTSQPRWATLGFPTGGMQDPRDEPARVFRYRGTDDDPGSSDYSSVADTNLDALCSDCHRQQVGFRRHRDARPAEEIVLQVPADPFDPSTVNVPFTVPHREHGEQGYADCVDCHMHLSRRSTNNGDVRSHSLLPNEWTDPALVFSDLWHFSETCGQCHQQAQDCDWCHTGLRDATENAPNKR